MSCLPQCVPLSSLPFVLAILLNGCATAGGPEPPASKPQAAVEDSSWAYFIDAGDDGDDIWVAGCHYKCSNAECSEFAGFWGGDWCSGDDLQEWTNSGPHAAESDIARHDCEQACKQKGAAGGTCVRVVRACDGMYPSSRCECEDD
jgi:hypothetical protein